MHLRRHFHPAMWLVGSIILSVAIVVVWGQESSTNSAGQSPEPNDFSIGGFSAAKAETPYDMKWALLPEDRESPSAAAGFGQIDGRTIAQVTGTVPAQRALGLVLAQLTLQQRNLYFNASAFDGVRLTVKGSAGSYAVRLRTRDTRFPGQYYQAAFRTNGSWQTVTLPFHRFTATSMQTPLNKAALRNVAVVAVTKDAKVDIYLDEIALYRGQDMYNELTPEEVQVIIGKGTEAPFTGIYNEHFEPGTYTCKRCDARLFESTSKFRSHCGWPSFDDQIPGAVLKKPDADGIRTEILCANCGGHLGHVFTGEGYTAKNTRYCVNSISMNFAPARQAKTERAIFASGCFWGTEYHMQRAAGVISTTVGFTGGHVDRPTYQQVCTGRTGHAEAVEVVYDPTKISYEQLAQLFFETHDFTQLNRQGPDIGTQYRSGIFYLNDGQKQTAERLVGILRDKNYNVKTEITAAGAFWPAEDYHQDYYNKTGKSPYCHIYRPIF